jgi:integrase
VHGGELPTITYQRAWTKARTKALTPEEQASPLARRPYHLRHACLSIWLNGGVALAQVAEWAGHSVDMLLRIYAKCLAGKTISPSAGFRRGPSPRKQDRAGQPWGLAIQPDFVILRARRC